jgi:hypothetical protein
MAAVRWRSSGDDERGAQARVLAKREQRGKRELGLDLK